MRQVELLGYNTVYPLNRIPYAVGKELSLENDARAIGRALPYLNAGDRHSKVDSFRRSVQDGLDGYYLRQQLELALDELEEENVPRAERRQAELVLADYVEGIADTHHFTYHGLRLDDAVEKMRACRQCGTVGLKPDGGHVVAWDSKCGLTRLCPDESREEQQRIEGRYLPHLVKWSQGYDYDSKARRYERTCSGSRRRVFYAVINPPNTPQGRLHEYKRELCGNFAAMLRDRVELTAAEKLASGTRTKWRPVFPSIKGALNVQEDPFSRRGDWNVHLNVILAVEGEFSYKEFRAWWDRCYGACQVEITELPDDIKALAAALRELIKYSAAPISEKAEAKYSSGASDAPPVTQWPHEAFLEWYSAGKAFRRTRSYGAFYRLPEPDTGELGGVTWVGSLKFQRDGSYWVDLIPEDNFSVSRPSTPENNFRGGAPPPTGPPG